MMWHLAFRGLHKIKGNAQWGLMFYNYLIFFVNLLIILVFLINNRLIL
jgi:hypothetical protein